MFYFRKHARLIRAEGRIWLTYVDYTSFCPTLATTTTSYGSVLQVLADTVKYTQAYTMISYHRVFTPDSTLGGNTETATDSVALQPKIS